MKTTNTVTQLDDKLHDTANAERFVKQHGDNVKYIKKWKAWFCWNDFYWQEDETGIVSRLAEKTAQSLYREAASAATSDEMHKIARWAKTSHSAAKLQALLTLAQNKLPIADRPDVFDANIYLLNCRNGTLDLRSGELREHDRNDMITRCLDVSYDPNATCPLWTSFLERVLPDEEVRAFLQRFIGLSLSGDKEQAWLYLFGYGANGKSVFIETILTLLGDYGGKTSIETLLEQDKAKIPDDLAALEGKRFIVGSELPEGRRLNESRIKDVTGKDTLPVRRLYGTWYNIMPQFCLVLYGNHKPVIVGTDDGVWRKTNLVPFTVSIPIEEQDTKLGEKLKEELSGILKWAVDGFAAWQENGLQPPIAVVEATKELREESDVIGNYLSERTYNGMIPVANATLYADYQEWCKTNGHKYPYSHKRFTQALFGKHYEQAKTRNKEWIGLSLLNGNEDIDDIPI